MRYMNRKKEMLIAIKNKPAPPSHFHNIFAFVSIQGLEDPKKEVRTEYNSFKSTENSKFR